jgi:hypothetical protein
MKTFSIISAVLGVMALAFAAYFQFVVVENAKIAESQIEYQSDIMNSEDDPFAYYDTEDYKKNFATMELRTDMGMMSVVIGGVIFIIGLIPVIKKRWIGLIGVAGGLIIFALGIIYGTHMF